MQRPHKSWIFKKPPQKQTTKNPNPVLDSKLFHLDPEGGCNPSHSINARISSTYGAYRGYTKYTPGVALDWNPSCIWFTVILYSTLILCKQPASFKWNCNLTGFDFIFLTSPIPRCSEDIKKKSVIPEKEELMRNIKGTAQLCQPWYWNQHIFHGTLSFSAAHTASLIFFAACSNHN